MTGKESELSFNERCNERCQFIMLRSYFLIYSKCHHVLLEHSLHDAKLLNLCIYIEMQWVGQYMMDILSLSLDFLCKNSMELKYNWSLTYFADT